MTELKFIFSYSNSSDLSLPKTIILMNTNETMK